MKPVSVVVFVCAFAMSAAMAVDAPMSWMSTRQDPAYRVLGTGDPQSEQGANVTISGVSDKATQSEGAIFAVAAESFRGHSVTIQADLSTHDVVGSGFIWIRVFGENGLLDRANTGDFPVRGNASNMHRSRQIDIPDTATKLEFGLELVGRGTVTADAFRLVTGAPLSPHVTVSPQRVLDAAISIVTKNALRSSNVDWATVEPQIRAMAANAKVPRDVYPAIRTMLKDLDDHHSFLMDASSGKAFNVEGGGDADPIVSVQPNGIGYVMMPGYVGANEQAAMDFVGDMASKIRNTSTQAQCGWIVDLRNDHGGNMYPMLGALSPFLGPQPWGSFLDGSRRLIPWHTTFNPPPETSIGPDLSVAHIAILTGPHTASSGEAVAVAFRGRPNTRSFGEPTAGLSTANRMFELPDGSQIVLTVSLDVDRNGQAYGSKLQPDQPVTPDANNGSDAAMNAATVWLMKTADCAD
jgi:carboxyl-terminal processing protease